MKTFLISLRLTLLNRNISDLIVTAKTEAFNFTIPANSSMPTNAYSKINAVKPNGYKPIGLARYEVGNVNLIVTQVTFSNNDYSLIVANNSNSQVSGSVYLHIMFIRDI